MAGVTTMHDTEQDDGRSWLPAIWHGTDAEYRILLRIVAGYCSCRPEGIKIVVCSPHQMLVEDQRAIDGLVFLRRLAGRLTAEEFGDGEHSG
jgi:hypothetical protein